MAEKFVLFEKEESTMVSTWTEGLYCSILKDGTLSLRLNNFSWEYGSQWSLAVRRIKTPKQFINAFNSEEFFGISERWDLVDMLPELFVRLPKFALATWILYDILYESGDESDEEFFYRSQFHLLESSFDLPSDINSALLVFISVFEYCKKHFCEEGALPEEAHSVGALNIIFPKVAKRTIPELISFQVEQNIKSWVMQSKWEHDVKPSLNSGFHKPWFHSQLLDYCREYLSTKGELPKGKHRVQNIEVQFPL